MYSVTHLLDTQAWIWLFNQEARARNLTATLPNGARVGISAITVWEAAMLEAKGRVHFHPNLDARVREMLARDLCILVPLLPEIAIASARLEEFHGDPSDRIIVATARHIGATLVTADRKILVWARTGARLPVIAI